MIMHSQMYVCGILVAAAFVATAQAALGAHDCQKVFFHFDELLSQNLT